jgi:uncharacterized SAM-binding protein YcdF (DUF218 family)
MKNLLTFIIILSLLIIPGLTIFIPFQISENINYSQYDYIVVPGAAVWNYTPSPSLKHRLDKSVNLLNSYESLQIVVTGGKGNGESISEACAMELYLLESGIKKERIITENNSFSTYENFKNLGFLIEDNSSIIIVTQDFHMLRSKLIASRLGYEVKVVGVKSINSIAFNNYFREFFALYKTLFFDIL